MRQSACLAMNVVYFFFIFFLYFNVFLLFLFVCFRVCLCSVHASTCNNCTNVMILGLCE